MGLTPLSKNWDVIADNDFLSLQDSVSMMLECLQDAENEAMDPPAPGLPVSHRVKVFDGQPHIEIDRNYLEVALQVRGPYQLAKVWKCSPSMIWRCALEYGLADPMPPVFQMTQNPNGTVSRTWYSSSVPMCSLIAEDLSALDNLVRNTLHTFLQMGHQKLNGMLKARGYRIPRERLRESYICIHGAPAWSARLQIKRRTYYVLAPNSIWPHNGNHSMWLIYDCFCARNQLLI